MIKVYYFPPARAVIMGVVLVLIGLSPIYGVMLIEHSVTAGLIFFLESFIGFPQVILGIMCMVFFISGILYLINARKILRLKLDQRGVYYLPLGESTPSKYKALFNMFYLKENLKLILYSDIDKAEHIVDKWWGDFIKIQLKNGQSRRLVTAPFSLSDKKEVVELINSRAHGRTKLNL